MVTLRLSASDHQLILEQPAIPDQLLSKLRFGLVTGHLATFQLSPPEIDDLTAILERRVLTVRNRAKRRRLQNLLKKLYKLLGDEIEPRPPDSKPFDAEARVPVPPVLQQKIHNALEEQPGQSIAEQEQLIRKVIAGHNLSPQSDLGDLAPIQVHLLLSSEWNESSEGLQLNEHLPIDCLTDSSFLGNCRRLLEALVAGNGTRQTAKGNLNRKFVLSMVDTLTWEPGFIEELFGYHKVLNEEDVKPLHVMRLVLELAGLVRKYKGKFLVTRKGTRLLHQDTAGILYASLFRTYMRRFNLAYLDRFPEFAGMQRTLAFSLYVFGQQTADWHDAGQLAREQLLPAVIDRIPEVPSVDMVSLLVYSRIWRPLSEFGLARCRFENENSYYARKITDVCPTDLFEKFISFEFPCD